MEGGKDVDAPLVADSDAAEAGEPRQGALDLPAVPAEAFAGLDAAPGDAGHDRPAAQSTAAPGEILAFVGMQLGRPAAWSSGALADGRDGVHRVLQLPAVVDVGRGQGHGERDA